MKREKPSHMSYVTPVMKQLAAASEPTRHLDVAKYLSAHAGRLRRDRSRDAPRCAGETDLPAPKQISLRKRGGHVR